MCAGFHVRRAPCLPGSCAQGYMLARFSRAGLHAYQVPFAPSSCVMNPMIAGFQLRWIPCVSGSMIVGLHLLWVLLRLVLALRLSFVMNSMHAGLQSRQTPITPGSMCYEFLCVLFLCLVNSMHAGFYVL